MCSWSKPQVQGKGEKSPIRPRVQDDSENGQEEGYREYQVHCRRNEVLLLDSCHGHPFMKISTGHSRASAIENFQSVTNGKVIASVKPITK